jgi:guanylate kinase
MKTSTEKLRLAEVLQNKAGNPSHMLSYLEDAYPIPAQDPGHCLNTENAANAYVMHDANTKDTSAVHLMISPSCTGQDSVIDYLQEIPHPIEKVVTATTRIRRPGEDEAAYVWMERPKNLSAQEVIVHLMARYDLVECQLFGDDYYGTPLGNLSEALRNPTGKPVVIKNDQYGARAIKESAGNDLNIKTIAMLPENYRQLWERLISLKRNNPIKRMTEAAIFMTQFEAVSDYVLLNRHHSDIRTGVERTARGLIDILQYQPKEGESRE